MRSILKASGVDPEGKDGPYAFVCRPFVVADWD